MGADPHRRPLDRVAPRPADRVLGVRLSQIVEFATTVLEDEGEQAMTMRRLAAGLGMQAPSLYKHVTGRAELESLIVERALVELGDATHAVVDSATAIHGRPVTMLLATYRLYGLEHPQLYRLATGPGFSRSGLTSGLEQWAGEPFYRVTGSPATAQALWAFAHGLLSLEIDDRLMPSDRDATWAAGVAAFAGQGAAG